MLSTFRDHLQVVASLANKQRNAVTVLLMLAGISSLSSLGCDNSSDARTVTTASTQHRPDANNRYLVKSLPPVFDDGHGKREVVFPIRNDSSKSVKIVRVDRSCSCSDAAMNRNELAAGEEGELRITLHHRGRFGPQRISCAVIPDEGEPWKCEVVTHIHQRIRFEPHVINFGVVPCSAQSVHRVTLEQRVPEGENLSSIQEVTSEAEGLVIVVTGKEESEAPRDGVISRNTHLELRVSPREMIAGDYFGKVVAKYKGAGGQVQLIQLPVSWRVPSAVETFPNRVLFGLVKKGAVTEKVIRVKRNDGGSLNDLEIAVRESKGEINVSKVLSKDKKELIVRIRLDASKVITENLVAALMIRVPGIETGEIRVPIIASIGGD